MDRPGLLAGDLVTAVDGLAEHVEDAAERGLADGHRDRCAEVEHVDATGQAVGRVHGDRADAVVAEVLLHLEHEPVASEFNLERVVDLGELVLEHRLDDDALDLLDPPMFLVAVEASMSPLMFVVAA